MFVVWNTDFCGLEADHIKLQSVYSQWKNTLQKHGVFGFRRLFYLHSVWAQGESNSRPLL
jgi:hypothetical protein